MLEWTADLSVGVAEIDSQHKVLFAKLATLAGAMSHGDGAREVPKIIDFLSNYVAEHFATEERYMARHNYPAAGAHKLQHQAFNRDLACLGQQLAAQGVSATLVLQLHKKATEWLVSHISKTDKLLGAFLKSKMVPQLS